MREVGIWLSPTEGKYSTGVDMQCASTWRAREQTSTLVRSFVSTGNSLCQALVNTLVEQPQTIS